MVIKQIRMRISLVLACMALLGGFSSSLQAQPRLLADEEMDQVCAKGSTGLTMDSATLNQIINFSQQTSLGQVSGSGTISVEMVPNSSGKSQITMGSLTTAGGAPTTIPASNFQVVNGTVQVSGNLNITMQTLPSVQRALQQNQMVLPLGFNPFNAVQGMGGLR